MNGHSKREQRESKERGREGGRGGLGPLWRLMMLVMMRAGGLEGKFGMANNFKILLPKLAGM